MDFINCLENACGRKALLEMCPMQDGDVFKTFANTDALHEFCHYEASTNIVLGLNKFVNWYKEYYNIS